MTAALGHIFEEAFDRIYVINLAFRKDRMAEIAQQLGLIGLTLGQGKVRRFDAVRPETAGPWPSIGARGCFLSHLGILQEAAEEGLDSVLILEDDLDWSRAFLEATSQDLAILLQGDWAMLHGGLEAGSGPVAGRVAPPDQGLRLTHFVALRGGAIAQATDYLDRMSQRPAGSPEGGPMHVDGAYSWFRADHPDLQTLICAPALGYQRPSATDIAGKKWFDRVPGLKQLARYARSCKPIAKIFRKLPSGRVAL